MQDKNHSKKIDNGTFEMLEHFRYWEQSLQIKIPFIKKLRKIEVRECLLSFGAELLSSILPSRLRRSRYK